MLAAELARDEANKELLRAASRAVALEAGGQLCTLLQHEAKVRSTFHTYSRVRRCYANSQDFFHEALMSGQVGLTLIVKNQNSNLK